MLCESDPKNLIVNYIPTPVTSAELRRLFEPFGTIESARVIVDRFTNHPKGYGFVKYTTEEAAKRAMQKMNGYEIGSKRLRVTRANGPQNRTAEGRYTESITPMHGSPLSPPHGTLPLPPPPPPTVTELYPTITADGTAVLSPATYTVLGASGSPLYTTAAMPTMVLQSGTGRTQAVTYNFLPSQTQIHFAAQQQQQQQRQPQAQQPPSSTVAQQQLLSSSSALQGPFFIDVDGRPVELVANSFVPPLIQRLDAQPLPNGLSLLPQGNRSTATSGAAQSSGCSVATDGTGRFTASLTSLPPQSAVAATMPIVPSSASAMPSQSQQQQQQGAVVRPLCFAPYHCGSSLSDAAAMNSFQVSLGNTSSAVNSACSYDLSSLAGMQSSQTVMPAPMMNQGMQLI